MSTPTADVYDEFGDLLRVAAPIFRDFGGRTSFEGIVVTLNVHKDKQLVRDALEEAGDGPESLFMDVSMTPSRSAKWMSGLRRSQQIREKV